MYFNDWSILLLLFIINLLSSSLFLSSCFNQLSILACAASACAASTCAASACAAWAAAWAAGDAERAAQTQMLRDVLLKLEAGDAS